VEIDPDLEFILAYVDKESPRPHDLSQANWSRILHKASHNRVLYMFVAGLLHATDASGRPGVGPGLKRVLESGRRWLDKLGNSVAFVVNTLSNASVPFLVVKTYKYVPFVTLDVDVLVHPPDFEAAKEAFVEHGAALYRHPGESVRKQVICKRPDTLKIDLHQGFFWQGSSYLDMESPWQATREQEIEGVLCPIPNETVELLLHLVHMLYERRYVTLLDLLFLRRISANESLAWDRIWAEARRYRWDRTLQRFLPIVNGINNALFPGEPLFPDAPERTPPTKALTLPYLLPPTVVWAGFWDMLTRRGQISLFEVLYYPFATARYYLTGRRRLPYYLHWFPLHELSI
jgi:hypothetical protein